MPLAAIVRHARETPDKAALIYNGEAIGYGRFALAIDAARRRLANQGLPQGGVAVLDSRNLLDIWVAGLALRSLGLTTVSPRLGDDLALRDFSVFVASSAHPPPRDAGFGRAGVKVVSLPPALDLDVSDAAIPAPSASPGGHIMLTSGTTGEAKKILMSAEVQAGDSKRRARAFDYAADSVVNIAGFGAWTSVGHNVPPCVWRLGGAVVLDQRPDRRAPFRVEGVTHATLTPYMLQELLAGDALAFRPPMRLFVGGGPLPKAQAIEAMARLTPRLFTYAATTETGPFSLTPVDRLDELHWHRLLQPDDVFVIDDEGQPAPPGQAGLLRIRALPGIDGYLDDEATTQGFFRDGCFQSGDLAVRNPDGRIALVGRITDVINIRGDKVGTAPTERALQDRLGAVGVCLFSMQGEDGAEALHLALQLGRTVGVDELTQAIQAELSGFPGVRVHLVEDLPRNDSGKVLRLELRRQLQASGAI